MGGESEGVAVGRVGEAGKIYPTRFGWKIESCSRVREGNGLMLGALLPMLVPVTLLQSLKRQPFYFFLSPSIGRSVRLDFLLYLNDCVVVVFM